MALPARVLFLLFATSSGRTVLGFMYDEDADAFRREFVR
jgi:hypothetical protein